MLQISNQNSCESGSCKLSEKIWAIVDDTKLYRLTFSKTLAEKICSYDSKLRIERVAFKTGKTLKSGEKSSSGLYGIMSTRKNIALRITMFKDLAEIFIEDGSCFIQEIWIE